jgi:glycogen operon protein
MLAGGDEFGRTQQGNNNAYCHDSPLTWLDWTLAKKNLKLLEFTKMMIALRKQLFPFLFSKKSNFQWFNASGAPEDYEPHVRTLHYEVTNNEFPEQTIRVLINCFDRPVKFEVPEEKNWLVLIDTDKEPSDYISPVDGCAWLEGYTVQVIKNDTIS